MVKIDHNFNPNQNQSQTNQTETQSINNTSVVGDKNCGFEAQTKSNQSDHQAQVKQKQQSGLITTLGSLLPFAPLVWEQFTGQKVPQISGTMAEIQTVLQQLQLTQTQILNNQQQLANRITNLETNAVQQFTNLANQFQSLRLTHTKERKEIEYNPPKLESEDHY